MESSPEYDDLSRMTSHAKNFDKIVQERDIALRITQPEETNRGQATLQRHLLFRREAPAAVTPVHGRRHPAASTVVTDAMLIRTSSGRTFLAPQGQSEGDVLRSHSRPNMRFTNREFGESSNQWPERGEIGLIHDRQPSYAQSSRLRSAQRGTTVRSRGRSQSRGRGRIYADQFGNYVLRNQQYAELVAVESVVPVGPVSMEIEDTVDDDDEEVGIDQPDS